jgi:transketolase
MAKNPKIIVLCADMGNDVLDDIKRDYPERFYNVGIAETLLTNMAVGLALAGKKPWIYGVICFTLYKALEQIRNYVVELKLPVKYALAGKDKVYSPIGISHWATEDKEIMGAIKLACYEPESKEALAAEMDSLLKAEYPLYIRMA